MAAEANLGPLSPSEFQKLLARPHLVFLKDVRRVAVAVSGGPDSLALLHLLSDWAIKRSLKIDALIVDHGLRKESAVEARHVKKSLASLKNVQAHILKRPAPKSRSKVQERARFDRYALMADYCTSKKIAHLFLAHHRDDQAETLLLRLAAGSGLDGLAAMRDLQDWGQHLTFVRPFLNVPKVRLIATCDALKLSYVSDPSNEAAQFARPRLRQARTVLEREGLTSKRLATTAMRLDRARQALDEIAGKAFKSALEEKKSKRIVFKLKMLYEQPDEIVLRLLITACAHLRPEAVYSPRLEKLEDLATALKDQSVRFRKRTLGGVIFAVDARRNLLVMTCEA